MSTRIIQKSRSRSRNEARELLQFFFVSELLHPSSKLWIVSPWLRNIEILDNRSGAFAGLIPDAPRRVLRLLDVLAALLRVGTQIAVVLRPPRDDGGLGRELEVVAASMDRAPQLAVTDSDGLHTKGIVGERAAIIGSMNFTYAGLDMHTELLQFNTDPDHIARLRLEFAGKYEG